MCCVVNTCSKPGLSRSLLTLYIVVTCSKPGLSRSLLTLMMLLLAASLVSADPRWPCTLLLLVASLVSTDPCWPCTLLLLVASLVSADPCWPCTLSLPVLLICRDCGVERCHTGATLGCRRQWHFSQQKCFSQQVTQQPSYQFKYTCTHSSILMDISKRKGRVFI